MDEQMIRKNNMKIFPIYKMFAWDFLFYYAIIFLFLTQVKGFSASQVLLADSFYAIFRILSDMFCVNVTDLIGKQKSLLVGNLFISFSILIIILGNGFPVLILFKLIEAIGFNLKNICEPTLLSDSIPATSSFSKIYSKIDGKGDSLYYIFDALSAIATGFLYIINPYFPMIMCFICCLISSIISLAFSDPCSNVKNESTGFIKYHKDIFITFKQILKSHRLKSLLLFSSFFWAILMVFETLRSSILVDIGVPEQYFGIILAGMQIISSLTSRNQQWFHNKLRNRALSFFSLSVVTCFILTGLLVACNISFKISLVSILFTVFIVGLVRGPYYTLIQRYLNSFSNPDVNTKIFAIKSFLDNIGRVMLSLFASLLLGITTTSYAFIIIGCLFFVIFIFLLDSMKTKVGLKPEQYPKEDLVFSSQK